MSVPQRLVLGADVGGTNTKIALGGFEGERPVVLKRAVIPSRGYASLELLVEAFLADPELAPHARAICGVCFAVAGPVEGGRARLTNLPWQPAESEIARHFGFPRVRIINDFAAAGLGIAHLAPDDLLTLQAGTPVAHDDRVVVGAGTGLGVALLDWDEGIYEVHPSEAGHTDFAPVDAVQDRLLLYLRGIYPRVSYERVLSGGGLAQIAAFLVETSAVMPSGELRTALAGPHPARVVSKLGLTGEDPVAAQALEIFAAAYGAFAGNMALTMLSNGGVYIAGGIAPKIAGKLTDGTFMRAFLDKGRMAALLHTMPVHVVMNEHVGLYGALDEAARLTD